MTEPATDGRLNVGLFECIDNVAGCFRADDVVLGFSTDKINIDVESLWEAVVPSQLSGRKRDIERSYLIGGPSSR